MILEQINVGPMAVNCYILASSRGKQAMIIDPGDEENKIKRVLAKHKLKPAFIVNTHGHYDHIGCDDSFGVNVYIHKDDQNALRDSLLNLSVLFAAEYTVKSKILPLEDRQLIKLDDIELVVLHTPGHTPGGISLLLKKPEQKMVFTGDTLFCQGVGRTDLEGSDESALFKGIKEKLLSLDDATIVYPGHGPNSTIGAEKANNQFLS